MSAQAESLDIEGATSPAGTKGAQWKTPHLLKALEAHYVPAGKNPDFGVFVPEVSINGTWGVGRRCDAVYAGFTSASGRILVGHELKVSRSDWLHELRELDKADYWSDACHAFYVVAPNGVVDPEELPHGWGLMNPPERANAKRFKIVVKAHVKQDFNPPWDAVRSIMARAETLKRHQLTKEIGSRVHEQVQAERKSIEDSARASVRFERQRRELLIEKVEETFGVKLASWTTVERNEFSPKDLKAAHEFLTGCSDYALNMMREHATNITEAIDALEHFRNNKEATSD